MSTSTAGTMLSSEIIELLHEMGLTRTEIQVYQYLLTFKSAVPSAIARDTGQARGRIYEGMRNLVEKGFAREEPTRPIQFFPTPLPEILGAVQARLKQQLVAIQKTQALVLSAPQTPAVPARRPVRMRDVRVLSGRRSCFAEMTRMLEASNQFFWLMGGGRFPERLANMPTFLENLRVAAARGVDVQIIVPRGKRLPPALADLAGGPGRPTVHEASADPSGPLLSCATETTSLDVVAQPDDDMPNRGDDVAVQVSSDLFATSSQRRFDLTRSFLNGAAPVYQWLGPDHGSDLFLEAVRRAEREILVLGPREWSNYMGVAWNRTVSVYDEARSRGVALRALAMPGADADVPDLERFVPTWDVRVAPWVPLWLTIVDGKDLYQAFTHPSRGGPPQFRVSSEPREVRFYETLFGRMWESGRTVAPAPILSLPAVAPAAAEPSGLRT